jgi:hypothetical protein
MTSELNENRVGACICLLDSSERSIVRDSPPAPSHNAWFLRSSADGHIIRLWLVVSNAARRSIHGIKQTLIEYAVYLRPDEEGSALVGEP